MKEIKAYLRSQKDIATAMWIAEMQKENINMYVVGKWNERVVVLDQLIQELGQEKTKA